MQPRENGAVDYLGVLGGGENETAARAAQGFMCGAGDKVRGAHRVRVRAGRDQARVVRHVHHQPRTDLIGDGSKALPVDHTRVGGSAGDDHARFGLASNSLHLGVVDPLVRTQAVAGELEPLAGQIHRGPVGEVSAVRKRHTEHHVAR